MPVFSQPVPTYTQEAMDFVMGLAVPLIEDDIPATYADFVFGLSSNAEYEEDTDDFFDDIDFEEADDNEGTIADSNETHGSNETVYSFHNGQTRSQGSRRLFGVFFCQGA